MAGFGGKVFAKGWDFPPRHVSFQDDRWSFRTSIVSIYCITSVRGRRLKQATDLSSSNTSWWSHQLQKWPKPNEAGPQASQASHAPWSSSWRGLLRSSAPAKCLDGWTDGWIGGKGMKVMIIYQKPSDFGPPNFGTRISTPSSSTTTWPGLRWWPKNMWLLQGVIPWNLT